VSTRPPELAGWMWRALAFLGIALLGAVVAIAVSDGADGGSKTPPAATTAPTTTVAPPPTTTAPATTTTATTTKPRPHPAAPPHGWTVVLQSLPAGARAGAEATARRARAAGLAHVGVLESSDYRSLAPGYLVVYSGSFSSQADAEGSLRFVRAAGFTAAYPRRIVR
jgi:hypothetical protein